MEYWLEVLEKPYIKETNYYLYKRNIKKHLAPALGDMFLAKIMQQDIQKMVDQLKLLLAPSTLHGVCRLLKSILEVAVKQSLAILTGTITSDMWFIVRG